MINPYKQTENINSFYVDKSGERVIQPEKTTQGLGSKCKPDMDWIYNECMMKNEGFRNMLEGSHKRTFLVSDPYLIKNPELLKKEKKKVINDTNGMTYTDTAVMTPAFNDCALDYQNMCRKFYETNSLSSQFDVRTAGI